jgi:DNA-directed RNA polymerase beta' subunit
VKDWAIRSVTSYGRMADYGGHSETERVLVDNEGLAILSLLKIQSGPLGNLGEPPFDGDEMNMHLPQNVLAETELRHLAAIPYQVLTPVGPSPIIGIYQDSLLGSFRFTRPNVKLTPREAMNLLAMFPRVNTEKLLENKDRLTSFDVLSQILPEMTLKYKKDENVLEIRNGKYVSGQLDKSVLGASTKGIIHRIYNDYGPFAATNFIDDIQQVVTEYMKTSSFSVGISDLIANKTTQEKIVQIITEKKMEVHAELDKLHLGIFKNDTSNSNMVQFETTVNNILNKATELSGKEGRKSLSKDNRFLMIVESGSKGTLVNISQMISCLGQTNVDGKRISYGFEDRTLPHFKKFDDSPGARGFIENSYISGLTAPELFFHAMGGRIGLIDTAVKSVTWETPVVLLENDKPKYIEIGRWIDAQLDAALPGEVQHFTERQMELMNIDSVYIPTTDEDGVVTWGEVTAITRHDPGTELYEIKTSGGRSVIVTESKSLLIWNEKTQKLKEMPTPEIKIGDCVPVTETLAKPPIVLHEINLSDYLSKREYIYGTEFHMATREMTRVMNGRQKIPAGWWKDNNGKLFSLPYNKKSSLQRTNVRSNIDNIREGFVYPYHAQRVDTCIQETFELTEENGIFIGLVLAEGHCSSTNVSITNNDAKIQEFVRAWFDKQNIHHKTYEKTNSKGYKSTSVIGNSSVLSAFLKSLVGHKSENKHIPTEAYIAKEEFIIGLLNGYYSGDGTISKNSVDVCSASKRLIEGISMLCSRLGIFGKVSVSQLKSNNFGTKNIKPSHRFHIGAQWGKRFADKIPLLEENKQQKLKAITWRKSHMNFKTYENVVLDKIVEINIIGVEKYPKVYDLTIPSTLNFGLANGLQVRDTSSTGYIQRRLIKGLEDLKVEYDMTVRNNRGKIVQFAYGDDGIDSTRVEAQSIPLVGMSIEDIYMHYDIAGISEESSKEMTAVYTKGTATRLKKQKAETVEKVSKYIERTLEYRDELVSGVFRYKDDTMVRVPVSFQHLMTNLQGQLGLNSSSTTDVTPLEAFEMVEETFERLKKLAFAPPTKLFEVLYYFYLTPRELLVHKRFHRKGLELLLDTVVMKYKQAIVHPGEMVGVVAGQSIGEPTTQLTLNSVTYETEIVVRNSKNQIKKVQIGEFVTEHMKKSKKLEYMEDKDTTYAELCPEEEYYEVPSATEDGRTVWTRIEAVTQHPVINEDGTDTMLKITTEGCREVIVTKAKSVLQLVDGKILPFDGADLCVGDYMSVSIKTIEISEICKSSIDSSEKIKLVNEIEHREPVYNDDIIPNKINGIINYELRDSRVPDLIFDKIVAIEEVPNTTKYAYDLTVAETRNFDCFNGICVRDTFHLAGVASKSNVTRGVPRIEEILRLTDNPKKPAMTIHLKSVDEADKDRATVYANMLEHTVLRDVVKSVQICFDPLERSTFIETDKKWMDTYYAFEDMMKECNEDEDEPVAKSKWVVRMELDAESLLERNITMDDVHFAIKNIYSDIQCIYSDYNDEELVFRIRTNADMFKKKKGALQSLDQSDDIYLLRNFQDGLLNNIVLRGVQGIENVLPRKLQNMVAKEDGKFVKKDTWVLDTTGTNMLEVLGTDFIDFQRTYSNDIGEVFDVLGIEAARQIIFNEFSEVMEFSDVNINYHHLSLLCDRMTVTKDMVAIFRSGLHNDNIGPIAKATFEVHTEILLQAARHADFDEMRGVSANVMCGQFGYYGTGAFNVILDMKEMAKQEAKEAVVRRDAQDIESSFSQKEDLGCGHARLLIKNNITTIHQENEGICQDEYDMGF